MVIYQALTRLFREGKFSSFDSEAFDYLKSLGVSHVWYTGVPRHSTDRPYVKGDIGSPYSVVDYYDVNPYLAEDPGKRMEEFEALVSRTHDAGLKLIIDFVPNHVSPDYSDSHGGIPTLGICDYDWTDTEKVNYSDEKTWTRMKDIICFWAAKGVDGFRCDMAEMVPVNFWRFLTSTVKAQYPVIFIAEVYNLPSYNTFVRDAGFDYLYDKSGLYDTLRAVIGGEAQAWDITGNWQRLGALQSHMLNFLENHDEQRLASPFFAGSPRKGYAALAVSALFYPCPFMVYFGQEIGEDAHDGHQGRTSIFSESRHIDPLADLREGQSGVLDRYREILRLKNELGDASNFDLCYFQKGELGFDMRRHFAFLRGKDTLVVANFTSQSRHMTIRIPAVAESAFGEEVEVEVEPWDYKLIYVNLQHGNSINSL